MQKLKRKPRIVSKPLPNGKHAYRYCGVEFQSSEPVQDFSLLNKKWLSDKTTLPFVETNKLFMGNLEAGEDSYQDSKDKIGLDGPHALKTYIDKCVDNEKALFAEDTTQKYLTVAFRPEYMPLCENDLVCCLVFQQLLFWDRVVQESHGRYGAIRRGKRVLVKSAPDLALNLNLTEKQVRRAYEKLEKLEVIAIEKIQFNSSPTSVIFFNYDLINNGFIVGYQDLKVRREAYAELKKTRSHRSTQCEIEDSNSLDDDK